ncbi:MAG: undecaprenyl/decaprenyl-phosphate alpha-N-acetylglucosaminyl 1-phosphate transferase [Firmicutes bacterium]|nr:undecaprenyl/decaprenyl-phosphate alpha-N-acetylglucosaminyl 1-phosphate transferase [Bacillota bacterium]
MAYLVYMEHDWILYLAAFASAFGITLVTTPFAKKLAFKFDAVQYPRDRDMHNKPMPRMGGVAIVLGFILTTAIMAALIPYFRTMEFVGLTIGGIIIVIMGILDDIIGLKSLTKLFIQIIVAIIIVAFGIRIEILVWPFTTYLDEISIPVTIFWIVGMTNAVNLIDGLDGLAAGVSSIGALCLMVLCILSGSPLAVVLSATLAGSCIGFLPRNFNPAEVFMGDTGSLFIGYVLAVSSVLGVFKGYTLLAILVVFFALCLPIFDTVFAFFRRLYKGRSATAWMEADRGHMHHRLIDAGFSQIQAVVLLYGASLLTAVIAIVIAVQDIRAIFITIIFLLALISVMYVYRKRTYTKKDEKLEETEQANETSEK